MIEHRSASVLGRTRRPARARARAAAFTAAMNVRLHARRLQHADARARSCRPSTSPARAASPGSASLCSRERDRARERRVGEPARVGRREAELARRLLERFEKIEHVRRTAARHAGDGIEHRLVVAPDRPRRTASSTRRARARAVGVDRPAARTAPLMPAPISAGVLGIARTMPRDSRRASATRSAQRMPAAIDSTTRHARRGAAPARARPSRICCGLTASTTRSAPRRPPASIAAKMPTPGKRAASLSRCVGERLDDAKSRGAGAARDQAADQRASPCCRRR